MKRRRETLQSLWGSGAAFFLEATVHCPYSGCWEEPNIWLVTPPGCKEHERLNHLHSADGHERCIWPLYASGQGLAMDVCLDLAALLRVVAAESVFEEVALYSDSLWLARGGGVTAWGWIDNWAVAAFGPINRRVGASERYWMAALENARGLGVELTWTCPECDQTISGPSEDDSEGQPIALGSHGDGGVGVHPTDVVCRDCASQKQRKVEGQDMATLLERTADDVASHTDGGEDTSLDSLEAALSAGTQSLVAASRHLEHLDPLSEDEARALLLNTFGLGNGDSTPASWWEVAENAELSVVEPEDIRRMAQESIRALVQRGDSLKTACLAVIPDLERWTDTRVCLSQLLLAAEASSS